MINKIRKAMGNRVALERLTYMDGFDQGSLEAEIDKTTRISLKRGRGSERQVNVVVNN